MEQKNFYAIYERLCKEKGVTNYRVYKDTGIPQSTLSSWKQNKLIPSTGMLQALSEYFGVSVDYLLGNTEAPKPTTGHSHWIPVLGRVAAGEPLEMIEDIIDYEEIDDKYGECFALQINGDSMSPRFLKGDVVIVKRQEDVESGEIAIVCVNGEDATCKKVLKHDNGISLVSLNPLYEPRFFTEEEINSMPISILGKVVELRGKL